jgi:phosphoserine/homoserine phosphotransferase
MIIATDLEGVLVPEIWVEVARVTGIRELELTTHDEPDFGRLMQRRVDVLNRYDVRLPTLQRIADDILPFPGATELLAWLRTKGQVMIASDTFHELSEGLVRRMGGYNLFANTFQVDSDGRIKGYRLRIRGRKDKIIGSLREIGFSVVAIGDGWNDERMLRLADTPILFNAPDALAERLPGAHRASTFEDVQRIVRDAWERRTAGAEEDSGDFVRVPREVR